MCGLVAEIFMLVFGIMALVTGKFTLTRARVVTGVPARVVGAILVLPLPLALVMGFLLGAVLVAQGKQITRDEVQKYAAPLELGIILICMLTAVIVAAITAHPPQKKGPPPR